MKNSTKLVAAAASSTQQAHFKRISISLADEQAGPSIVQDDAEARPVIPAQKIDTKVKPKPKHKPEPGITHPDDLAKPEVELEQEPQPTDVREAAPERPADTITALSSAIPPKDTKVNVARDLFILSTIAFSNGKTNDSAQLYAAALCADDYPEFIQTLTSLSIPTSTTLPAASTSSSQERVNSKASMADQVREITMVLSSMSSDDTDADGEPLDGDDEDADDEYDDEVYADVVDPNTPGQRMVLPSLSTQADNVADKWKINVKV